MKKVIFDWSYPMDINNILYDERMGDTGLYYITRTFGEKTSDLYIGKTNRTFESRLEDHTWRWLNDFRGVKKVRLGYLTSHKTASREIKNRIINDAEMSMIWLLENKYGIDLLHNKQCKISCHPSDRLHITNIGRRGSLPEEMFFTDDEWDMMNDIVKV